MYKGTNCPPLLADLFLSSYKADVIHGHLKKNEKKLARSFYFTFCYMDDVLSLNNSGLMILLTASIPLTLKDTDRSTSYLALQLEIDSEGRLRMNLYDKKRGFQLSIYMKQHSTCTCIWSIISLS